MYYVKEALYRLADDEQELREEHLENAEAAKVPHSYATAPVMLAMKSVLDTFPIEQEEVPKPIKPSNKRKLEDVSPGPNPKRQKL